MSRSHPPAVVLTSLLEEEQRIVSDLSRTCGTWRVALAAGLPAGDGRIGNSIDTLCMRFGALEGEVSRLLEAHGYGRSELPEAVKDAGVPALDLAFASLLDSIRDLSRANFINACLLDRWTEMNRGLLHAILAAVSPTYVTSSAQAPSLPAGARLSMEA